MSDELVLTVGGHNIAGWTDTRVTRGMERCPNDFDISLTESYPDEAIRVLVQPGAPCDVRLGNDLVITGYVDQVSASISSGQHDISITGRGKCQDLVDCSAEWPSNQISGSSVLNIAKKLGRPYGIDVTAPGYDGKPIQQINLMWGETGYDVIERLCRYSGLLAYEGPDGNLILSRVGTRVAASGFTDGENVEEAQSTFSQDQRFSTYIVRRMSMDPLREAGGSGDLVARIYDKGVKRHRMRYIIAESGDGAGKDIAKERGLWECSRRFGRSACLTITTDSWRDASGALWEPNTLVDLSIPSLKADNKEWCITEVTYNRSEESGSTADLTIMPPEAFLVEPLEIHPIIRELEDQ